MKSVIVLFFVVLATVYANKYQWNDPRVNILGSGWDLLENAPRQSIFVLESEEIPDLTKPIQASILPDGVIMVDYPEEQLHFYAEVIDQNENTKNSRDVKISGGFSFWKVGGSFSTESKTVKTFISSQNHKVTRVNGFIRLAEFSLQTWRANMSDGFKERIVKIRDFMNKNTTLTTALAKIMADEVLNLYGEFAIVGMTSGGYLTKIDSVDMTSWTNSVDQTLSASAQAHFSSYFKVSGSYNTEHSDIQKYSQSITDSWVTTQGGEPFSTADNYTSWFSTVKITPTSIALKAIYVVDLISLEHFPEFSFNEVLDVRQMLNDRAEVYLDNNIYTGCADPSANNYVSYANVFDDSLCNYQKTFHFGGMYTVASNPAYSTVNLLTEGFSCPAGFTAHPLLSLNIPNIVAEYRFCWPYWTWILCGGCCTRYVNGPAIIADTYVCMANQNMTTGVYFGGVYTTNNMNDITQDKSCPEKYIPYPIYLSADKSQVIYVCMATYDSGHVVSVPFGGIFSSQYPNYMIGGTEPVCGSGFERHPVGPNPIAEVTYCIGVNSLNVETKDIIPPGYGNTLEDHTEMYHLGFLENGNHMALRVNPHNQSRYEVQANDIFNVFVLYDQGKLPKEKTDLPDPHTVFPNEGSVLLDNMNLHDPDQDAPESVSDDDDLSGGQITMIVIVSVLGACFLLALGVCALIFVIVMIRKIYKRRSGTYDEI